MPQSRREQLQAYRFMQRRVRTALLDADPDTNDAPLSRMGGATYAGIMIAILVLAAAGIYGIFNRGGSKAWQKAGTLIVERETGAEYVYLAPQPNQKKLLFQVKNATSAQLILGPQMSILDVAHNSLNGTPHGGILGIRDAPEEVPKVKQMAGSTWSVCVGGDLTSRSPVAMQIQPGVTATGKTLAATSGLLLRAPQGTFLLAQNHVYLIPPHWLAALVYQSSSTPAVAVTDAFIASIPRGQTLQPLKRSPQAGRPGPTLGPGGKKTKVGQVLRDTSASVYYLVVPGGLAPLTPLQASLQLADTYTQTLQGRTTRPILVDPAALTGIPQHPLPQQPPRAQQAPATRPTPLAPTADEQVCVIYPPTATAPTVVYGAYRPVPYTAGLVRLPLGSGAVVQTAVATGTTAATYFISDAGEAYPIDAPDLAALGLDTAPVGRVSSLVLDSVVKGPPLTEASAATLSGGGRVHAPK